METATQSMMDSENTCVVIAQMRAIKLLRWAWAWAMGIGHCWCSERHYEFAFVYVSVGGARPTPFLREMQISRSRNPCFYGRI